MSYARLTLLNLGPDNRSLGETIADRFAPLIREQKGFQQVSFFSDVEAGEYGSLTLGKAERMRKRRMQLPFPSCSRCWKAC
ncbi:MAG: hypothetical protein R3E95_12310 [Thiolinea sp.]